MESDPPKTLIQLIHEELRPIKELSLRRFQLERIEDQLSVINEKLDEIR